MFKYLPTQPTSICDQRAIPKGKTYLQTRSSIAHEIQKFLRYQRVSQLGFFETQAELANFVKLPNFPAKFA